MGKERVREREQWLKAHGVCVTCGNSDAEPGRIRCRRCLDVRKELSRNWKAAHPDQVKAYMKTYLPKWRAVNPNYCKSAGRLKPYKPRIIKPPGTCRRKDCWESAVAFSCWCPRHRDEMRERRGMKGYLEVIAHDL